MQHFDLCLAWNWEYDADFVSLLEAACARRGLTTLPVTPLNLQETLSRLASRQIAFHAFLDRASDADPAFQPLADRARGRGVFRINPQELCRWADDKATMHLEFISHGIHVPYTILLAPFQESPALLGIDLTPLGGRFAIKPAHGGGGEGVIVEASSIEEVHAARQQLPAEKYLLQAHIQPCTLDGRPAWFRVLYCGGMIHPCWWDTATHVYAPVTDEQAERFGLRPLWEIMARIARVCRLDLFSSEIGLSEQGLFLVADYVNNPIDLRLQSKTPDGVPDAIVESIAERLAMLVEVHGPRL
jgi:hypothetical protein